MNRTKRIEILETLVANAGDFLFNDFQMILCCETGEWRVYELDERAQQGEEICRKLDPAEAYEMAHVHLAARRCSKESTYITKLENVAKRLANAVGSMTSNEVLQICESAKRALKSKPKQHE